MEGFQLLPPAYTITLKFQQSLPADYDASIEFLYVGVRDRLFSHLGKYHYVTTNLGVELKWSCLVSIKREQQDGESCPDKGWLAHLCKCMGLAQKVEPGLLCT
jgi:hypothetical protein